MWRVFDNLYDHVQSVVLAGNSATDWFSLESGLRQGCTLSPLLFLIFINELVREIHKSGLGVEVAKVLVNVLLFADDVVLVAKDPTQLQLLLDIAWEYSQRWRMDWNLEKSEIVIFGNHTNSDFNYHLRPCLVNKT